MTGKFSGRPGRGFVGGGVCGGGYPGCERECGTSVFGASSSCLGWPSSVALGKPALDALGVTCRPKPVASSCTELGSRRMLVKTGKAVVKIPAKIKTPFEMTVVTRSMLSPPLRKYSIYAEKRQIKSAGTLFPISYV